MLVAASCGHANREREHRPAVPPAEGALQAAPVDIIKITEPAERATSVTNRSLKVAFEPVGDIVPDSVHLYFDGSLVISIAGGHNEAVIPAALTGITGLKEVRLVAFSNGKRPHSVSRVVTFNSDIEPDWYRFRVVNRFPHDTRAYTQGLLYHEGWLYEGTGLEGESTLRKVDLESGEVVRKHRIDDRFFGEGITVYQNRIYQLTWTHNTGFIYDLETFREVGRFYYNTEGWGLTTMGDSLVMSDGTNRLYFMDPNGFNLISSVEVHDNEGPVSKINELEYINGEIWANIFLTDKIVRIDPISGRVIAYIDLEGIIDPSLIGDKTDDVLNGVAWDPENERIFVTGKRWPYLFEIELVSL